MNHGYKSGFFAAFAAFAAAPSAPLVLARRKQCLGPMRIRVPRANSFGAAALLLATRAMLPLGALLAAGALLSL